MELLWELSLAHMACHRVGRKSFSLGMAAFPGMVFREREAGSSVGLSQYLGSLGRTRDRRQGAVTGMAGIPTSSPARCCNR